MARATWPFYSPGDDPEQDDSTPHTKLNFPHQALPPVYMELRKQAEQGENALRHAWGELSAEDKHHLLPYIKGLKKIAQD